MGWGYAYSVSVYVAGERPKGEAMRLAEAVSEAMPHAHFVGITISQVRDEPQDQVAT